MTGSISNPMGRTIVSASEQADLTELILGREEGLLAWLSPLVRRESVTLDLGSVKRIDAAGIAALLSLYSSARKARHRFSVSNLSPRVAEVLSLVRILLFHHAVRKAHSSQRFERTAAGYRPAALAPSSQRRFQLQIG
jgi:anti-anti-sigma regulatory factor